MGMDGIPNHKKVADKQQLPFAGLHINSFSLHPSLLNRSKRSGFFNFRIVFSPAGSAARNLIAG